MELSIAAIGWLVQVASRELLLFASVGILLIGLDDLFFDALWLATGGAARRPVLLHGLPVSSASDDAAPLAIFVPTWQEQAVIAAMLERSLALWQHQSFRIYIGCYANDAATLFAVSPLVTRHPQLRLVIGDAPGPTTKADNLNRLWQAMGEDERTEGIRFSGVVLHDAEDVVHPDELALYRRHLDDYAMVQIPVVPIIDPRSPWVTGHYADEFAEAHGKELPLRAALGLPVPSAGVGCALSRNALTVLSIRRDGLPFRADSLTEDYELGVMIGGLGLRTTFVDAVAPSGERIVSRGAFPGSVEAATRQKARWVAGIALAGWDYLGWGGPGAAANCGQRAWLARWMLWRDRRAPLAALVLLAAYGALLLGGAGWLGREFAGWPPLRIGEALQLLLALNFVMVVWRLGLRTVFTLRCYGWRRGLLAPPRAFVSNIIAMLAARRAIWLYCHMLASGRVVWEKTIHDATALVTDPLVATRDR